MASALLMHGRGLGVGPDADGLLNLGDTPEEEWAEVGGAARQDRHRLFDVQELLGSSECAALCRASRGGGRCGEAISHCSRPLLAVS